MKHFTMGITYLRNTGLQTGIIGTADNDDTLIQRIAQGLKMLDEEQITHLREKISGTGDFIPTQAEEEALARKEREVEKAIAGEPEKPKEPDETEISGI